MNFRTEIKIARNPVKAEHYQKYVTIGSCFAENIAGYFKYYLFNVLENPFGVLYNPVSICNAIKILNSKKVFTENDLIYDKGEWHSFYHHSDFSHEDKTECLNNIKNRTTHTLDYLTSTEWIIISLGTSYVYRHKEKNIIVSNCHKMPASDFIRELLTSEESKKYLTDTINLLRKINPAIKIILTVSPIRHIKDGFAENQLSKSSLIYAVHEIINTSSNCFYFPSYEIMMDDLRDYRFYEKDMLHPNKIAIEYIWEKFSACFFSDACLTAIKDIEPYSKGTMHRPRNPESAASKAFEQKIKKLKDELIAKYPYLGI